MRSTTFLMALATMTLSSAQNSTQQSGQYKLTDDLSYTNFFASFDFFSGPDPTQGFVQYQNLTSSISQNLIGYLADTQSVFLGVDYTTKDAQGRNSVRLESKKSWNHGLLVADIRHMPSSQCGTWPAFWMLSSSAEWPQGGEIDILEGVNEQVGNAVTLHTSKGCVVNNATAAAAGGDDVREEVFTGFLATADCDVKAENQRKNVGCSIHAPETLSGLQIGEGDGVQEAILPSYGTEFNKAGGGVYAMEWTSSSISVWFFPRNSPSSPFSSSSNSTSPDPSTWGSPLAHFSGDGCAFDQRFKDLKIIFDTTFCGEWAGKDWDDSCAAKTGVSTCEEYVRENPGAFTEAYWEVQGLKWYEKDGVVEQGKGVEKRDGDAPAFVKAKGREFRWWW